MTVYMRSNGSWIADILQNGKRVRKTCKTQADAEAYEKGLAISKACTTPFNPTVKVNTVFDVFWQSFEAMWRGTSSEYWQYIRTNQWVQALGPNTDVKLINSAVVQDLLIRFRNEKGNKPSTLNKRMSCLRKIMKNAKKRGLISDVPEMEHNKLAEIERRILRDDEELRLYAAIGAINPEYRWLSQFLLYTGMRVGEAIKLEWKHIDQTHKTIHLWQTKGKRARHIPLIPQALEALQNASSTGPKPWTVSYRAYAQAFKNAKADLGLADDPLFVIHSLRHTCATWLVRSGVNPRVIQKWLGHSDLATTMIYMRVEDEDMTRAAVQLSARHNVVPFSAADQQLLAQAVRR